jgi:two-component system response regulator CpxR
MPRPKKIILCVDDNENVLSIRKFLLVNRGYFVITASSGEQAIAIFRAIEIDVVLTDLAMPNMDGNELVRRLKEIDPEAKTIIVSGTVKAFDRANHAEHFLPKGSPVEDLLGRLRMLAIRKRGPKKGSARACPRLIEVTA